nr:MAG TPA: hypothetical protein [Caudoviricetes sp.]
MAFLDETGLAYFWGKVKDTFCKKSDVLGYSSIDTSSSWNLTDKIAGAGALKDALTAKLIWSNAAPSAEFVSQTITLSGNYDAVLVMYKTWYISNPVSIRMVLNNNTSTELNVTDNKISYRRCKLNGQYLTFESGNNVGPYGSQSTANGVVVPTHVYGLNLRRG